MFVHALLLVRFSREQGLERHLADPQDRTTSGPCLKILHPFLPVD